MKVNELSKNLGVTNKDLISYLSSNGYEVYSHLQTITDEMIESATNEFAKSETKVTEKEEKKTTTKKKTVEKREIKTYSPTDMIPCRSVSPWKIIETGADRNSGTIYQWNGFGDVEYVTYRDLQYLKRRDIIKNGRIVIDDPDLCSQWSKELGESYKCFLGVNYPEEFFNMPDSVFESKLKNAPDVYKEVIKYTALDMIRAENYPSVQKLAIIDNILGTCIKEFI